jgi:hypothetical protein
MPTTLYTIDRRNAYSPGTQFVLRPPDYSPLGPIPLDRSFLDAQFPKGLSNHGQRYLINWSLVTGSFMAINGALEPVTYSATAIEVVFELVRRLEFPDCLSRFQAMFACQTEAELKRFAPQTGSRGTIYEIEVERFQIFDVAFLHLGNTISHAWLNARGYWSGAVSINPLWEYLMELPVTVGQQVGTV